MGEIVTMAAPESTRQVIRACVDALKSRLPTGWTLVEREEESLSPKRVDAALQLTDPTGTVIDLVVEAKRVVERRDLGRIRDQLNDIIRERGGEAKGLVAGRYLSPQVRTELAQLGLAYVDATGNMRIALDRPAIFLADRVTDRDPWRGPGRPRGSLKGDPAARVVRTLIDYQGPLSISDLLRLSGASTGATYRVRDYLIEEGLLEQLPNSTYRVPDWPKLLREWAADYALPPVSTQSFIAPRGIESLRTRAANAGGFRYAVTGSLAAEEWAPYAPAKLARVYVQDIAAAATWLDLRPTDVGQNVLLVEPKDPRSIVFENTWTARDGVTLADPSQVAVDLLNGPGRNPAEGEALIAWMAANEEAWRK
jgi:hypothetical protein